MQSKAETVEQYLDELPEERRVVLEAVRAAILQNLPEGYEEGMQYGMIGYFVPHSVYPDGYHCDPRQPLPLASLASQKNHMAFYLMSLYGHAEREQWFRDAWKQSGKKLDMGKSCVRFKKLDDVPLDVVAEAIRRVPVQEYVAQYEQQVKRPAGKRSGAGSRSTKKATSSEKKKPASSGKRAKPRKLTATGTTAKTPSMAKGEGGGKAASGKASKAKPSAAARKIGTGKRASAVTKTGVTKTGATKVGGGEGEAKPVKKKRAARKATSAKAASARKPASKK